MNEPKIIDVEIECNNCGMFIKASHNEDEKRPIIYTECPFCQTKLRWTKTKTSTIIPADKKMYITINLKSNE